MTTNLQTENEQRQRHIVRWRKPRICHDLCSQYHIFSWVLHSDNAILPAILSALAFLLSLAGWWVTWLAGLITMIIWVIALCVDLPHQVMQSACVFAIIAFVGELLVALRIFDQASIVCTDEWCSSLDTTTNLVIVAIIATVLWAIVALISYRRYW